jgi:L-fuconolactonase
MPDLIDAHQHFWQRSLPAPFDHRWQEAPDKAAICRDFLPQHLEPLIQQVGVARTIFVQTQHHLEENRWALKLAEQHDFIAGVVGWIDLASPACEEQLLQFIDHPKFVGVRHITQDEPDDDFIIRVDVVRGLKVLEKHGVPFDLLFYVKHLKHAAELGQALPGLRMVIDHLAKPRIREGIVAGWRDDLKAAAASPNVYCKLSGMITEADWHSWKPADLKPYVQAALNLFGPQRCMFGSDWPVCELAGSYQQVFHALNEALGPISQAERGMIFGETARKFYGLPMNDAIV